MTLTGSKTQKRVRGTHPQHFSWVCQHLLNSFEKEGVCICEQRESTTICLTPPPILTTSPPHTHPFTLTHTPLHPPPKRSDCNCKIVMEKRRGWGSPSQLQVPPHSPCVDSLKLTTRSKTNLFPRHLAPIKQSSSSQVWLARGSWAVLMMKTLIGGTVVPTKRLAMMANWRSRAVS